MKKIQIVLEGVTQTFWPKDELIESRFYLEHIDVDVDSFIYGKIQYNTQTRSTDFKGYFPCDPTSITLTYEQLFKHVKYPELIIKLKCIQLI